MVRGRWLVGMAVALIALGGAAGARPAWAQGGETAGMITEVRVGHGKVEVKTAAADWRPAAPLGTLRPGDQVRAAGDATAVVLLVGGRGTVRVDASGSPYTVPGPQGDDGKIEKARTLLSASMGFLSTGPKEPPKALLTTRGPRRQPPEVLTPRNGPVLPDSLVFEWLGSQFSRYTVRLLDPSGIVLERKGVVGARFAYPADAPPLRSGVRYRFQVEALDQPLTESWFEILDPARAAAIRDDLARLEADLGPGVSPNSLAAVKGGALAAEGLYHDARLVVLAALARDPDEPSLHLLLGNLYLKTGLPQLGAESLDEAKFLMSREK
ncbi:MAG TPA: hypothetical protein VEL75_04880 [Candidatus Methylomirabilis sp.]|nr:hypothetical protein [Candidatus Methylomirabilis sp.]